MGLLGSGCLLHVAALGRSSATVRAHALQAPVLLASVLLASVLLDLLLLTSVLLPVAGPATYRTCLLQDLPPTGIVCPAVTRQSKVMRGLALRMNGPRVVARSRTNRDHFG